MSIPEHMHVSEGPQRFDVFTGGGRRRRFTAAEKAAIVDESYADGTSVCGVARRHGLPPLLAAASQDGQHRRARAGGKRPTAGDGASGAVAAEARDLVRRAAGDVAGKTVAAQVRQAARHLGYPVDDWRVREAWYRRAGTWSAAAVDELRGRFAAWRGREAAASAEGRSALAGRVATVRRYLDQLTREVEALEAECSQRSATSSAREGSTAGD